MTDIREFKYRCPTIGFNVFNYAKELDLTDDALSRRKIRPNHPFLSYMF